MLVKAGGGVGQTGGREERDVAEERAQNLRRLERCRERWRRRWRPSFYLVS